MQNTALTHYVHTTTQLEWIKYVNVRGIKLLYVILVRPTLEFASIIWSLH